MKKVLLSIGFVASLLTGAYGQTKPSNESSVYEKRKLKLEEVNLVSSYYLQDGNNSAVTGGVGTEKLWDFANSIDVKLTKFDKKFLML